MNSENGKSVIKIQSFEKYESSLRKKISGFHNFYFFIKNRLENLDQYKMPEVLEIIGQ